MPGVVFVHGGSHAQLATLDDPALAPYRLKPVHVRWLEQSRSVLEAAEVVVVCDRLRTDLLVPGAHHLLDCARRGASLVVFGVNQVGDWMPGTRERERATNFWWWRTGEDSRLRQTSLTHPAWHHFCEDAVIWHYHAVLDPPDGAASLVELRTRDGALDGSILYVDEVTTPGRLLVTTMDPVYHHGSGFMPGATQLLYASLQWATRPARNEVGSAVTG